VTNLNDGVGKKIVEALKKQTEIDKDGIIDTTPTIESDALSVDVDALDSISNNGLLSDTEDFERTYTTSADNFQNSFGDLSDVTETFNDFINHADKPVEAEAMPGNIIILKKLISQLPSGVTRHTGAQIIKQTMEALGISMKSVLTEAQEVQNNLKESSKECQMTIQEYKQKIVALEKQTQNYQKQYSALNDLISLFIQTTK